MSPDGGFEDEREELGVTAFVGVASAGGFDGGDVRDEAADVVAVVGFGGLETRAV